MTSASPPDALTVRPAAEADLPHLGALKLRASLAWGDLGEELRGLAEAGEVPAGHLPFVFVAEEAGGRGAGFATVLASEAHGAELEDLFVEPELWGRGVGRRLMAEAERRAAGLGAQALHVVANKRALPFYEAVGLRVTGWVETLFEAAPAMRKDLG